MSLFKKDGYWWIDYYDEHGSRRRKKVSRAKKVAQDTLEEVKTLVRQRKLGIAEKPSLRPISLRDFFFEECTRYFETNLSQATAKRYMSVLKHFAYFVSKFPKVKLLSQVQPDHVEKYKTYRKTVPFPKGLSYFDKPEEELAKALTETKENGGEVAKDNTLNFELGTLRSVFNLAIRWKYLAESPVKGVKFRTVADAKKPRFLSKEEVTRLLDNCCGEIQLALRTLLLTGMRSGELMNLEWRDIDFTKKVIRIRNKDFWQPKRRHERDIPIHRELLPLLREHRKANKKRSNFVFCNGHGRQYSENALRRKLVKVTKQCSLDDVTRIHSLRHTFGSQLVLSGVDLPTVRDLMGHRDIQTTMIYVHRTPDHLTSSINKLSLG